LFGLASQPCLELYDLHGARIGPLCHDWIQRFPVPADEQAHLNRLMARAQQAGMRLEKPVSLPPFDGVFVANRGRVIYRATTPAGAEARRLVERGAAGEEASLPMPAARYYFVHGGTALAGWADPEGTRI